MALATCACGGEERPRNAILIVLDTLRADRTSLYGGPRPTTPALDRLARRSVVFERAVSNSTWTLPAMAALLAGRYVDREVMGARLEYSLVEVLRDAGFQTAAFSDGGFVSRQYGFARGFDAFQEQVLANPFDAEGGDTPGGREIAETFRRAKAWLDERHDEPFFLLIHSYETHTPYVRQTYLGDLDPDGLAPHFGAVGAALVMQGQMRLGDARLAWIRALYDGGVREGDRQIGLLIDRLAALGRAGDTVVVVTSDHGEDLGDRDPPSPGSHGHTLFDELALVPLIVHDPTRTFPVSRVSAQVRTIDTMPTVLDLLGVALPERGQGRSLRPLMEGTESADRPAWLRLVRGAPHEPVELYGLRTGRRKLVVDALRGGAVALYDLEADPAEQQDVAAARPDERDALLEQLATLRRDVESRGLPGLRIEQDGVQAERLRALGYIE